MRLTDNNYSLSEELTQECFYQAFTSIHRFKGKSSIKTWLCQISKNCWMKCLRENKIITIGIEELEYILLDNKKNDPIWVSEQKEHKNTLFSAIKKLKTKQRNVFILKTYYDMTFNEIEEATGIKADNAKVIFHRVRVELQKFIG